MSFTSFSFLTFLAITAAIYRTIPWRLRPAYLLGLSFVYYCSWSVPGALILAVLTLITYLAPIGIQDPRPEAPRGNTAIVLVVLLTGYIMAFKVALLTPAHGIGGLIMPLGISYYTFRLISYVLDVHWGKIERERRLVPFAAYIAFFPQLVAGPIQRAQDFFLQLPPKHAVLWPAVSRIGWGLTKKLIIADNLAPSVNYVYAHVQSLHGAPLWLAFYLFPLQLYADFSGLTDISIGAGMLFGITGPENFNRPFTASSISDYWRRWHISLTRWLADYLFTPLRMSMRSAGNWGLAASTAINMVAIGIWHGLTAGYVVFGLIHSVFLIGDALTVRRRSKFFKANPRWDAPAAWLGWVLTFHLVALALVYFRAPRLADATALLGNLWQGLPASVTLLANAVENSGARALVRGLIGYGLLELGERYRPDLWLLHRYEEGPRWMRWSIAGAGATAAMAGMALLLASGAHPVRFIYEVF